MDARPILVALARVFREHSLEVIMIGNSAAALQGAPVTTLDVDFLFRKTPANLKKLKKIAESLGGVVLRPYYPTSDLYRLMRDGTRYSSLISQISLRISAQQTVPGTGRYWRYWKRR